MTIDYEIEGKATKLNVPDSLKDMNESQFVWCIRLLMGSGDKMECVRRIIGMQEDVWNMLTDFDKYSIYEAVESVISLNKNYLSWKEWKIQSIAADGEVLYGPTSNFANITWGEFVYADQCMIQGYYKAVVAALFRQERKDYDGETDRRIAFSTYGTVSRFGKLESLDPAIQMAIIINYRAMRSASLESVYTEIFPYHDDNTDETDEEKVEDVPEEESKSQFSWTAIHRNLIGDNIQDEEKFLQLPVHTVLYRLNQLIIESKKNRKTV